MAQTNPFPAIDSLLEDRIEEGDFPSASYLIRVNGREVSSNAIGMAVREPLAIPATRNTIYDLASLTKPLVTALVCALAVQEGRLKLDEKVSHYLPEFDTSDKRELRITELLTHTSGLPAWRPLYLLASGDKSVARSIAEQPLDYHPGTRVLYSDLGFIALGFVLERLYGTTFKSLVESMIFRPLSLARTIFNPDPALRGEIAASESGNRHEEAMCLDLQVNSSNFTWRTGVVWGEVHDGNAWFLGGAAGHAGLFSDLDGTAILAEQFLPGQSSLLSKETCATFIQNRTPGLNESRSLGWQLAATPDSTAGPELPPESFGHNGFTGTSCWVNPNNGQVNILLTNRTHLRGLPFANINSVRRKFNTLAQVAGTTAE